MSEQEPKLQHLDHVAISVRDLDTSVKWYTEVLGLEKYQPAEWKPFPAMMLAGSSGIALFPERDRPVPDIVKEAFHIAFRMEGSDLAHIQAKLDKLGIPWTYEDLAHFDSIFFRDPDGYRLEITVPSTDNS